MIDVTLQFLHGGFAFLTGHGTRQFITNSQVYFIEFQQDPAFIQHCPRNPRLDYRQGVHVLSQRRTEPAMRGILDTATDAGLRALDVRRYTTDA